MSMRDWVPLLALFAAIMAYETLEWQRYNALDARVAAIESKQRLFIEMVTSDFTDADSVKLLVREIGKVYDMKENDSDDSNNGSEDR